MSTTTYAGKAADFLTRNMFGKLLISIVLLISGIISLANPELKMIQIALCIGVFLILIGLIYLITVVVNVKNKAKPLPVVLQALIGIAFLVMGILAIANKNLIGEYIPVVYGLSLIVSGIFCVIRALLQSRQDHYWWTTAVFGAVVLILGIIIFVNPSMTGKTLGIILGIGLVLRGVSGIVDFIKARRIEKE